MTLQQLEYIIAVDKYRHFVKAAESCQITQSTLSALIQKLETELDITIFDRNSHPVKPTLMGEKVISQAKVLLYNASQLKEMVLSERQQEGGSIHLGIASTIAPYILPKLFKELSLSHPQIQLSVEEARVPAIIEKLERAELDVALLATPLNNKNLLEIPIYKEAFVAYISPTDALIQTNFLSMNNLPSENIWVLQEAYCPNNGVFSLCSKMKGNASIYKAGSIETLVRIVDENGGFTIIPELHVPLLNENQKKQIKLIENPEPSREIALVIRKDYVRERILNILATSICKVIPEHMVNERLKKFGIKL